jgi:hypothetical protein
LHAFKCVYGFKKHFESNRKKLAFKPRKIQKKYMHRSETPMSPALQYFSEIRRRNIEENSRIIVTEMVFVTGPQNIRRNSA